MQSLSDRFIRLTFCQIIIWRTLLLICSFVIVFCCAAAKLIFFHVVKKNQLHYRHDHQIWIEHALNSNSVSKYHIYSLVFQSINLISMSKYGRRMNISVRVSIAFFEQEGDSIKIVSIFRSNEHYCSTSRTSA